MNQEIGEVLRNRSSLTSFYEKYRSYYSLSSLIWTVISIIFIISHFSDSGLILAFNIFLALYCGERWFKFLASFHNTTSLITTCKTFIGAILFYRLKWDNFFEKNGFANTLLFTYWAFDLIVGYLWVFVISLLLEERRSRFEAEDLPVLLFRSGLLATLFILFYLFDEKYSKDGSIIVIYLSLKLTFFFFKLYLQLTKRDPPLFLFEEEIVPASLVLPFSFTNCPYNKTLDCAFFYFLSVLFYLHFLFIGISIIYQQSIISRRERQIRRLSEIFPEIEGSFICALCQSQGERRGRALTCSHYFHLSCLEGMIWDGFRDCPTCRQRIF